MAAGRYTSTGDVYKRQQGYGAAFGVHALLFLGDGGDGFDRHGHHQRLAGRNAAEDTAAMVGRGIARRRSGPGRTVGVVIEAPPAAGRSETVADLHALDRPYAHERLRDVYKRQVVVRFTVTVAAVVQLSVPVITAIGGVLFVNEPITLRVALSSAAILGGIFFATAFRRG